MLKFEGKFKVGDIIKAYDFQPRPDVEDSFILGEILEGTCKEHGYNSFKVNIIRHVVGGDILVEDTNTEGWIPHGVSFGEFDDRITKVA